MSAFHPALTGILYGALAQHEQALIQMALAASVAQADVDPEITERYGAIVDGLKRLIKAAEPSGYDASTIGVTEETRRKHALLGDILSQLTDFKVGTCTISPHYGHGIQINMPLAHQAEVDPRAAIREIAHRLDLQYGERRHGTSSTTLHIDATGKIQDVDIEIYELITAERPICDAHHVMVDADGKCPECPVDGGKPSLLAELRLVHVPELHLGVQVCTFCSEKQETPIPWPCSDLRFAEVELGGPEVRAEVRRTHFGQKHPEHGRVCAGCSDAQGVPVLWPCLLLRAVDRIENVRSSGIGYGDPELDGTACIKCHKDFAVGETSVPAGVVDGGPQVFAHPDCLTESTTTEPPGDAP